MPRKNKEERRAYNKTYYLAHKKEICAKRKAWILANKKRKNEYDKAYYMGHKKDKKVYYQANKKKIKAYQLAHKKEIADMQKTRRREHPEKQRVLNRKRRASKHGVQHKAYATNYIFERDNWTCQICGRKINKRLKYPNPRSGSIDHIIPLSKGGSDASANVQATHLRCNVGKNATNKGQLRLFG